MRRNAVPARVVTAGFVQFAVVTGILAAGGCTGTVLGPCIPECDGLQCGDDGCGGVCACPDGIACDPVAEVCAFTCGNGMLDDGETCDPPGSCPTDCDDGDPCTTDRLVGTADSCSATCIKEAVVTCGPVDRCCPSGCSNTDDGDCDPVCGNGVIEGNETCDGADTCPSLCDDNDPCTTDTLVGAAATCDARCETVALEWCVLDFARGIEVGTVAVDQGVRIAIGNGGDGPLSPDEHRANVIARRPTMVRAEWTVVAEPFMSRQLRGVLILRYPDETTVEFESFREVAPGSPDYADLTSAFVWQLEAADARPGTTLAVEVYEADQTFRNEPSPDPIPRFPAEPDAFADLGVDDRPMTMEVLLVPITHEVNGQACAGSPGLDAMVMTSDGRTMMEYEYYGERLTAYNPVERVDISVREPVTWRSGTSSAGPLLDALRQLRENDNANPWVFYYGLIIPCDGGPRFSGVANRPTINTLPRRQQAQARVGWGVYRDRGRSASTFVHEIGHQQGRKHVDCGNPADPDEDYPNSRGAIDHYGWDIYSSDRIHDPNEADYMSYCDPEWVSEYGWNLVTPWIAEMSQWPTESFRVPVTRVLYATVEPGQWSSWWTGQVRGDWREPSRGFRIRFYQHGTLLAETTAEVNEVPEDPATFSLAAALPSVWSSTTHIAWSDGASESVIPASMVRIIR